MSDRVSEKITKYELVPPDGGWGYAICAGFIINYSTVSMFMGCFGMLYDELMVEIGMNSTTATLLNGLGAFFFALSGFFTSSLLKLISFRKAGLLAVLLYDAGAIGTAFVTSISMFFLCQSFIMGIGVGLIFNLSISILNDYFVKRRMFVISLGQFFIGLNVMVAPIFLKWSLEEYGFRGTQLLVAGISLHNIIAIVLMQPVTMHLKRVEIPPIAEMQPLLVDDKSNNTTPTVKLTDEEKATAKPEKNVNEITLNDGKKSTTRRVLEAFVDIPFAKKFVVSCACAGPAICTFADITFSIIMPQALYALNWNQETVALAISTSGFGDLAMRSALIFAGSRIVKIGTQEVYVTGILLACVSRLCMLGSENVVAIFFYIFLMGVGRSITTVLISLVLAEAVPAKHFTEAVGLNMLFTGTCMLILGPAIGAVRDLTNSYNTAFYLLTSCFAIVALFWSIELCYKKNKDKRKIQKENLEKIKCSRLNKGK